MSNYPSSIDDDSTLPPINDNIVEIGGEAINALRDAVFNIETEVGIGGSGSSGSIANRINVSIEPDGSIKSSALTSLGLVTLPITNSQISAAAGIPESKLTLDFKTQDLFNLIQNFESDIDLALGWISLTGIKLDPHILGLSYRHTLDQIDVSTDPSRFLKNKFRLFRDNSDSYNLINDINNELLAHQFADGSVLSGTTNVVTNDGSTYPSNYAHTASGIFLNTSRFATISQTAQDLQQFADFIDNSSIFLLGTRIQNLYSNGISRVSRSSSLILDGYGVGIVPETSAIAYLLDAGLSSSPFDDIDAGDDIIEFKPITAVMTSNLFDSQFAKVKVGDILRINYGTVEVQFLVKEKKYISSGGGKKYVVRINGKNLFYSPNATARIDRPLLNNNKPGVLALAAVNNSFTQTPSLIVGNPRGAMALGLNFNADLFDSTHYLLYLAIYPTGNPTDGYTILPGIDVTGNRGTTPGKYTLESIIEATNNAFHQIGYNYRFIAFSYQGEFGVMLADSYNNTGFSILSAIVASDGTYDSTATGVNFRNNAVGIFGSGSLVAPDPLGLGPSTSNIASPPFMSTFGSPEAAQIPTKIFLPLKRNNYYVNGVEKEKLNIEESQSLDTFGDGYWPAVIHTRSVFPGAPPVGRVETTYRISLDLSSANLKIGKTIVVQSLGQGGLVDFGRFIIKGINISCPPTPFTDITVYDAVHGTALSPVPTLDVGGTVAIYFNSDSVSFNKESATDFSNVTPFKRHFEVYIDQNANTFTHERGRINISGSNMIINGSVILYGSSEISKLNLIKISSKLRGYQFSSVNKITLHIINFDGVGGNFTGQLASYDGSTYTKLGPLINGKVGEITRFYDETNSDFIDVLFDLDSTVSSFSDLPLDIQLFPTLSLDDEIMLLGRCQLNDTTNIVNYIQDERQFGNTSEKDLTTSALNLISLPERVLNANGVIRGFDLSDDSPNPNSNQLYLTGGMALVNGQFIQANNETVAIPIIKESFGTSLFNINWALCLNEQGEYQAIPLLDNDSSLPTPNNITRKFKAFNPLTGLTYFLDATTFTDLVESRKDLVILYIVTAIVDSTVIPPTISLTLTDARKYVNDSDTNFPIILTSDTTQGNFRSLTSVMTWLNKNSTFNAHVRVRGVFDITTIEVFDFTSLQHPVIFEGDSATFNVQIDQGITLGSFVKFKNINFVYNFSTTTSSSDFVNVGHGLIYSNIGLNETLTDVAIEDCTFSVNNITGNKYSYIGLQITDATAIINNLVIKNNKFLTQNSDDFSAAISIINTCPLNSSVPKLSNVLIENNICDSEQMIILTTTKRTGIIGDPGISCVNVKISRNICGSIGAMTTSAASGGLKELNNFLLISENTCHYIATLDETGKFLEAFPIGGSSVIFNDTGNVTIKGNKCAFIHYGVQSNTFGANSLQILENNLTSNIIFGTSHTIDYLSNFNYPSVNKRFAIYVSAEPSVVGLNNTTISKNRIGGSGTGYESYIRLCTAGFIINNYFEKIFTAVSLTDPEYSAIIYDGLGPGIISQNYIARGSSNLYSFITTRFDITSPGATYSQVINNTFDSSTTDGTNEVLGKDAFGTTIDNYWLFEKNKNQIKSIVLSLKDTESTFNNNGTASLDHISPIFDFPPGLGSSAVMFQETVIAGPTLLFNESGTDYKNYYKYFSLDNRLPSGVTITSVKAGIFLITGNFVSTGTQTNFSLVLLSNLKYDDVLDVKNNPIGVNTSTTATLLVDGVTITNAGLKAATNYIEALPSATGPYKTGTNYSLSLVFNGMYAQDLTAPTGLLFRVSPIKIKFKW